MVGIIEFESEGLNFYYNVLMTFKEPFVEPGAACLP